MKKLTLLVACLAMVCYLSAKTIYLNTGDSSLWGQANPVFFVHAWGGASEQDLKMDSISDNIYSVEINDDQTSIIFVRMPNGSTSLDWDSKWNQTENLTINSNNCFTITGWSVGSWSTISVAVDHYLLGSGIAALSWSIGLPMYGDSIVLSNVAKGSVIACKVNDGGSNWYGISALDSECSSTGVEGTDNIEFTTSADGDIKVVYKAGKICVTGAFGGVYVISAYTVIGDSLLLGSKWKVDDTANDLTEGVDAWSLTKTNVALEAGSYNCKVVGDHSYDVYEYPSGYGKNYSVTISERGIYSVAFTFDPEATENNLSAVATKTGDLAKDSVVLQVEVPANTKSCYVAANSTNWTFAEMTKVDDTHFTLKIEGKSDTIQYKYACAADWAYVEVDSEGTAVGNRTWTASDVVAKWAKEVVEITSYTIVGDSVICLVPWKVDETTNELGYGGANLWSMGMNRDIYVAGTYYCKVVGNHSYDVYQYPAGSANYEIVIPERGNYTLNVTFNPTLDENNLNIEVIKIADLPLDTTLFSVTVPEGTKACYIAANSTNWTFTEMTKVDDVHYTVNLPGRSDTIKYKYACAADWDYVEVDAEGNLIENRSWTADDVVARWAKQIIDITSYTVVGDSALVGRTWSTSATENDLVYNSANGLFELSIENVALKAGKYYYKAVANHAWGVLEVPAVGNDSVEVAEAAYYNVAFALDTLNKALTCTLTKAAEGTEAYEVVYGIEGGDAWTHVSLVLVDATTELKSASVTLPADLTNYKCYVAYNGGIGDPVWVDGKSALVALSEIGGENAATGKFNIYSDSSDSNWYLHFTSDSTTGLSSVDSDLHVYVLDGTIYADEAIRIYTVNGMDVTELNGQLQGIYIVKTNNQAVKVTVK